MRNSRPQVLPEQGQIVTVRQRQYIVTEVLASAVPAAKPGSLAEPQHLVTLNAIEDDAVGESAQVIWEVEPGARAVERIELPEPSGFDPPARLDAFLDAVRWGAIASADVRALQAPFRSGIEIEDYQLDPLVRAVGMPRVSLLIADDVGLGKTVEAGLVIQELIVRNRARTVLVVCPAGLQAHWRDQMRDKFGLEFRIVDSALMRQLRRSRGIHANPWSHFPRLITSVDFLKREGPMRRFREVVPDKATYPRRFDILIVDEAHNVAPQGHGLTALDSQRTQAIRAISPHFEHKLFLTATPHNGYRESFSALLELLDNQRFARGVQPNPRQLEAVMVRRLKSELVDWDGKPRFPVRRLEAIEVDYDAEEKQVHAWLREYTRLREQNVHDAAEQFATEFVLKLLKKRLFSSPAAFAITLARHRETLAGRDKARTHARPALGILRRQISQMDEEYADDAEYEDAAGGAVETSSRTLADLTPRERWLLEQMAAWATKASAQRDCKTRALIAWLRGVVKPGGQWSDERVILFTEYRATQSWLQEILAAEGLASGERLLTLYGGMDEVKREQIKAAFQASPAQSPVRILLATDAASEGIDLQNHCHRLVHFEIPWNPNRMEQRNGRIDRHGQRRDPLIYHFVAKGYRKQADPGTVPASELEADLEFLARAAEKVEQIREDLGKVGPVIAAQVEEAMLGKRTQLDTTIAESEAGAVRRQLKFERDLRRQIAEHYAQVQETRRSLDLTPENVQAVVETALALAGQPPLIPAQDSSRQDAKAQRGLEREDTKAGEGAQRDGREESPGVLAPLREDFIAYLKDQTGRSESALRKALTADEGRPTTDANGIRNTQYAARLRAACNNDASLLARVLPFAALIRDDDFGRPTVIPAGSVYVTAGTDRRSSGTHYTPRVLTEPVVEHTLAPLVYIGPAEGWPREKWQLRSPAKLLELKICDMAMGSGAFLVQSDRYLAERLVEAWELRIADFGLRIDIYGEPIRNPQSEIANHLPADPDDRLILARRLVAERCLYGVDKNPLAVEMAKLSLWLVTMAKGRPFDFLDHALKCGDSLIGASEADFLAWSRTLKGTVGPLYYEENERALVTAREKRRQLAAFLVNDVRDAEVKAQLLAEADAAVARVKRGCDLLVGTQLVEGLTDAERETWLAELLIEHTAKATLTSDKAQRAVAAVRKHNAFHWFLEFPEVFTNGGFHGFVGNPPFLGGRYISGQMGQSYLGFLKRQIAEDAKGNSDLVAYFYLRAHSLLRLQGAAGMIGTKTIAEGDTHDVGMAQLVRLGGKIIRSISPQRWPGTANVLYVSFHWYKGPWHGKYFINERPVGRIGSRLTAASDSELFALSHNITPYQGSYIHGMGFMLTDVQRSEIIAADPRSASVILPCLSAEDFNSSPTQAASRFAIYFGEMSSEEAQAFVGAWQHLEQNVKAEREKLTDASLASRWWRYKRPTKPLYDVIWQSDAVLVCPVVTKHLSFAWLNPKLILLNRMYAFLHAKTHDFTVLQSNLYSAWAWQWSGKLHERLQFAPSDCFDNFAFPGALQALSPIGETYHEHRRQIMLTRWEGLTATYNRFHNPDERAADIARLRELHVEMDRAVVAAYGWSDLDLGHGFHETAQGVRFTISEAARREVLARLLELNHQRYAEEVMAGMHGKGKVRVKAEAKGKKAMKPGQGKVARDDGGALKLF